MNKLTLAVITCLAFSALSMRGALGQGTNAQTSGPHGGAIVHSQGGEFEVVINPDAKKVDVFVLSLPQTSAELEPKKTDSGKAILEIRVPQPNRRDTKSRPTGIPLTRSIQLQAADPWRGMPHYQAPLKLPGEFNIGNTSQKGLEFEIRL